ncbi:phosphotransferase [Oleiagrimonas sp. C23AA]|uniref:phosphotransferase enzyme family protein n=1 Tax=Oleiagrimonas sp. C23AA TaxID=2719047 RepID=UPI00141F9F6A|nr:phosphotransferase [Oleiagrimonas sp. C23AA]NII10270.1 phosphotransferase [Oleiagrimonas sp. C23AA]
MSATPHRVHGLAADETAPDWPPITGAELATLFARFADMAPWRAPHWHSPRPLSAACLVHTEQGELFIKRHHQSVRSAPTLAEEHTFMAHLRQHGAGVPQVVADAEGQTAIALGEWTYEVHTPVDGVDLYRELVSWEPLTCLAHAHAAGLALAQLHDAAEGFIAPKRSTHILVARSELITCADAVATLQAQLPGRPALANYLAGRDWQQELRTALGPDAAERAAKLAAEPRLWTHSDWHASNLAWSGDDERATVSAAFDFGLAAPNFALFDLATAIERNAIEWLQLDKGMAAAHIDTALALIDGYTSKRPLTDAQRKLLADTLRCVHVDFAISETEYFHGITGSTADADVAWATFLLGHAAWFDSAPGQALLHAIAG